MFFREYGDRGPNWSRHQQKAGGRGYKSARNLKSQRKACGNDAGTDAGTDAGSGPDEEERNKREEGGAEYQTG